MVKACCEIKIRCENKRLARKVERQKLSNTHELRKNQLVNSRQNIVNSSNLARADSRQCLSDI